MEGPPAPRVVQVCRLSRAASTTFALLRILLCLLAVKQHRGTLQTMIKLLFIEHDGTEHPLQVAAEGSVMLAAVNHGVPGIDADCGGACSCGTCHVYVDEAWVDKLPEIDPMEEAMLSLSSDRKPNSRLSCQLAVTEELDGLAVQTPEFQY